MYRNNSYDEDLAKDLRDPEFAQGFLLDLIEGKDGLELDEALRLTIQKMGVVEFCSRAKMSKQNVNSFLKAKRNVKPETLDALLKPFGLRTKLVVEKAS
ncbi:MAG: DNA-binding protein [Bdellovibrionia bacterium]